MKNAAAIFVKQVKDTVKNKTILIQFLMFPVITLIMENAVKIPDFPEHFFADLFSVMFIGMAPITCTSAVISEEKEKDTLRVLLMSNVKPFEYLLGVGSYVLVLCMTGTAVIGIAGGYSGERFARFMVLMAAGTVISILIGAAIGTWSRNQMTATGVAVPVMCVLSFLPMLAMFNDVIAKLSTCFYTGQISGMIGSIGSIDLSAKTVIVMCVNALAALTVFLIAYRKKLKA